jgi:hypothetical protein
VLAGKHEWLEKGLVEGAVSRQPSAVR